MSSELVEAHGNKDGRRFVSTGEAQKVLGLCGQTLRLYARSGKIDYLITEGGKFRFDVQGYIARKKAQQAHLGVVREHQNT